MKKIVLTENYYGHLLEVTVDEYTKAPDFIPDEVKEEVFELLQSNETEGTFSNKNYKQDKISGSWRIIVFRHDLLYPILCWQYNEAKENYISILDFTNTFGKNSGSHYYEKWEKTFRRDINKMIWYFNADNENGQKFLSMLQTQFDKYRKQLFETKQ